MDVPLLLAAVSANFPCGDDLEYDPDFLQLERDAQGRPERVMGDSIQPAEPPQWRAIEQSSVALLQRSKDLRITHFLLQSALALDGVAGLGNVLTLISELLKQYWADIYPQLDADDDNDPTVRINALSGLTCDTNIRLLRESVLIRSRAFGTVSLRAALSASGLQSFADETLTADTLSAALRDSDPEQLDATRGALSEARSAAEFIERFVSEQVGSAQGVDLSPLKQLLRQTMQILGEQSVASADNEPVDEAPGSAAQAPASIMPSASGDIATRDDVLRSLDRILSYYTRHEPSSPLPVLLNRAKNLVHADFEAIVRNLIPDGMSQFENLRGPEAD
ncbi:type VI secretion system protein TssA [Pseudomonas cannabina]|uniref:Type VI secretion system protein TssA n=3 Tax=Pseudomonas syringae group TaxID=136849 RepID=A0A8T8CA13_PSEYM|nr:MULTISPECIES: type VI secretion system protein TssA [Pseudomonas syringae group]KPB75357.1 ImpA [Pseudomonas syringae pv. maculicola]MBM0140957.1 type VI secretion system protein TssA [Pseudomonas cannabina pv. alisalensis]QHF00379.1 type VI secretion system protein TssA [Pseudomonas syringae pv. maculicola str. ES4326]QQN24839.1 type VI secretion system protein TssA [Pseudomonas cannabina pv. alisalensis]RMN78904.1 ImpA [Pseudomonas cannabina pv. alisalensis]